MSLEMRIRGMRVKAVDRHSGVFVYRADPRRLLHRQLGSHVIASAPAHRRREAAAGSLPARAFS
jgi:hypothetical protein